MSHSKERIDKNCLNCNTETVGRFCHICGQENTEPRESFSHLVRHFLEDLTHFDGKFFRTIIQLFTKPGFLASEYIKGRRATYLNPIRFYIFVSAFFFLLLTGVFMNIKSSPRQKKENAGIGKVMIDFGTELKKKDSLQINDRVYNSVTEYDSVQAALPEHERDGAIAHYVGRKMIAVNKYSADNREESEARLKEKFFHTLPYALFISLPVVALILQLLYWRRKQHYYVSHIIFLVYMYCFVFLVLLLAMTAMKFGTPGYYIANLLRLSIFVYLFLAMKRYYAQGIGKTLVKFILFTGMAVFTVVLFSFFVVLNAFFNLAN